MNKIVDWNINNYVTVKLCDYGIEVYTKYLYNFYNIVSKSGNVEDLVSKRIEELCENDQTLRLQGWDMINIFGQELRLGSRPIFHECNWKVEIEE